MNVDKNVSQNYFCSFLQDCLRYTVILSQEESYKEDHNWVKHAMKYPSGIQPSLTYLNFLHKLFELFELLNEKIRLLVVQRLRMYTSNSLF